MLLPTLTTLTQCTLSLHATARPNNTHTVHSLTSCYAKFLIFLYAEIEQSTTCCGSVDPWSDVYKLEIYTQCNSYCSRSHRPRALRRRSAAARLLRLWVRIPPGVWMFVCFEDCVLSGRGLCNELITRPVESYRLWCIVVCDLEITWIRRPWSTGGCRAKNKQQLVL
jgi:hypothetical protein